MINFDIILGTGKTTSMSLAITHEYYLIDRALWLAEMTRIPRKLKKSLFKNRRIKNLYKQFKAKEKENV